MAYGDSLLKKAQIRKLFLSVDLGALHGALLSLLLVRRVFQDQAVVVCKDSERRGGLSGPAALL